MIKILIADDEPLVRAGIKAVIPWNDHGFDVIGEVSDGNEAYEKILALKPDILITDIKMPGMDGITLLKKLKQEKVSIQSVVLSCFDEFELVREAMKYGARDYILKLSIDPAKILEVLGEIRQDLADLPENEPHFSLNTDDLKYLFIKNRRTGDSPQMNR
ncbi:MAG: response regulator [Enterocloster clostridioformis]